MLATIVDPVERFFAFARERHQIYLNRSSGKHWPWTEDPILREYRFTNVFRELDKTTVWFRENVRDRLRDSHRVLFATVAFRWFNRIETGRVLNQHDLLTDWDASKAKEVLKDLPVIVTGAFIVRSPDGMTKLDGIIHCIQMFWNERDEWEGYLLPLAEKGLGFTTLQGLTTRLIEYPMMGKFMAYEVATDMRFTKWFDNAPDIMNWANPGPGARRGMQRLNGNDNPKERSRPKGGSNGIAVKKVRQEEEKLVEFMRKLLRKSKRPEYWPADWPKWEMREVEHTLCEFDKYERVRLGQGTPRGKYTYADYCSYLPEGWGAKDARMDPQKLARTDVSGLSS